MKFLLLFTFACTAPCLGARAQTFANGDFETNASAFSNYPGYVGGGNPVNVPSFAGPAGGYGINPGSGTYGAPFRDNGNDNTNVLFIQSGGATLTQAISGLVPGQAYDLAFEYNARNCCNGSASVTIGIDGASFNSGPIAPVGGGNAYYVETLPFIAGAGDVLSITKNDAAARDSTALLDNFVITSAVPEPSTWWAAGSLLFFAAVDFRRRNPPNQPLQRT